MTFQRYLSAKRTVDDRALDRRLLDALSRRLERRSTASEGPLRVLEVGAGVGTMVTRLVDWDLLPAGDVDYVAVDVRADNVAELRDHLRTWARDRTASASGGDPLVLDTPDRRVEVDPVVSEAADYVDRRHAEYDLLIGAALLDIFDLDGLDPLLRALRPGGLYYFPITFDGATRFRPTHPADRTVERRYHDHMDGKPGGSSRAGGDVLDRIRRTDGVTLLEVGGSDWIVRPSDGSYPADEAYFLRHILDTIEGAVTETTDGAAQELSDWLARRRAQLDDGELVYLTHQLDFLGRVDDPSALGGSSE